MPAILSVLMCALRPNAGRLLQTAGGDDDAAATLEASLAAFRSAAADLSAAYSTASVTTVPLPKALIEARGQVSHALGQAQEELESVSDAISKAHADIAAVGQNAEHQLQQLADELAAAVDNLIRLAHGPQLEEVEMDLVDQLAAVETATDVVSGALASAGDSTADSGGSDTGQKIEAVLDKIRDLLMALVPGSGAFAAGDSTGAGNGSTSVGSSAADLDRLLAHAVSLAEAKLEKLWGISNATKAGTEAPVTEAPTPINHTVAAQASAKNEGSSGSIYGFSKTTGMLGG